VPANKLTTHLLSSEHYSMSRAKCSHGSLDVTAMSRAKYSHGSLDVPAPLMNIPRPPTPCTQSTSTFNNKKLSYRRNSAQCAKWSFKVTQGHPLHLSIHRLSSRWNRKKAA